jgi:NAD(P)-dependent dehydrogenase (short-subunit alcohol dehydrogenase family)
VDVYGRVDCVVNNAGIVRDGLFHTMNEADRDAMVNAMLKGAFNCSRAAAEYFRTQESGCLIHMTSTSGLVVGMAHANDTAAKLGLVTLSEEIASDMAQFNVRSNCIAPVAWTRTSAPIAGKDTVAQQRTQQRDEGTPEQKAPLAVFLASDAAREVNAQVFAVRKNEIFLMSESRPVRSLHRSDGWTPEDCAEYMLPVLKASFSPPVDRSADVFSWDSIQRRAA